MHANTILVPIDFSEATETVIATACVFARAFRAKIVLTHAAVLIDNGTATFVEDSASVAGQLSRIQDGLRRDGFDVDTSQLYGPPAACIQEEAERVGADCIVIGSHGHGALYDVMVGSTASHVLKNSPCPVLVVPIDAGKRESRHARLPADRGPDP